MTMARREVVIEGVRAVYHCSARCVRRAFLCGFDHYSGNDYGHRREWFRARMAHLNELFAVDFLAYAVMSNHWHCVIRTRPDEVEALTDEEVVRRWMKVFPKRRSGTDEQIRIAVDLEVKKTLKDLPRVSELRRRLCSVSWFMKSMNEYIARRSNHEDDVKGRFWEGRFGCQRLLDEASILACMVYVDLNPVRASMAESVEDSEFTSAYDRVASARASGREVRLEEEEPDAKKALSERQEEVLRENGKNVQLASWLVDLDGPERPIERLSARLYLEIVDYTGRRIRSDKGGRIPPEVTPILEALDIDAEAWVKSVKNYGRLFYRVAGKVDKLVRAAKEGGLKWFKGRGGSAMLFKAPEPAAGTSG